MGEEIVEVDWSVGVVSVLGMVLRSDAIFSECKTFTNNLPFPTKGLLLGIGVEVGMDVVELVLVCEGEGFEG